MHCEYTPANLKKELGQAIILSEPGFTGLWILKMNFSSAQTCSGYMIVDFLNSIFSFFTDPGIFPDT